MSSKHIAIVPGKTRGKEVGNEPRVLGMPSRTGVYRFGPFQLDVQERRLLRDGAQVPLRLKAFETLRVLVDNAERLVTKETLLKQVWGDFSPTTTKMRVKQVYRIDDRATPCNRETI